jgi:hypothetical protein
MATLSASLPTVAEAYAHDAGASEGYTIGEHTGRVAEVYNTQSQHYDLDGISDRNGVNAHMVMEHLIALHDIGKGRALELGDKNLQHEATYEFMAELEPTLTKRGMTTKEQTLMAMLASNDGLGQVVQGYSGTGNAAAQIVTNSQIADISAVDYLELNKLLYVSDAASYPYLHSVVFNNDPTDGKLDLEERNGYVRGLTDKIAKLDAKPEEGGSRLGFSSLALEELVLAQRLPLTDYGHDEYARRGSSPDKVLAADKEGNIKFELGGYDLSYSPEKLKPLGSVNDRVEVRVYDHIDYIASEDVESILDPDIAELHFVDLDNQKNYMLYRTEEFDQWLLDQDLSAGNDFFQAFNNTFGRDYEDGKSSQIASFARNTGMGFKEIDMAAPSSNEPSNQEAYEWFESGDRLEWARGLSNADKQSYSNYYGFGYRGLNENLRGIPPTKTKMVRNATDAETRRLQNRLEGSKASEIPPPEGDGYHYTFSLGDLSGATQSSREGYKWRVVATVPDQELIAKLEKDAALLDEAIRERGHELQKDVTVHRGAYLHNTTGAELIAGIGGEITEPAFTSTFYGPANGRLTSYAAMSKADYIYQKYTKYDQNDSLKEKWSGEKGTAVRFHINVPAGSKVAPIESVRHVEQFRYRDNEADYLAKSEEEKNQMRSESEMLLPTNAKFKIVEVRKGEEVGGGDDGLSHTLYDVWLEYTK